MPRIKKRVPFRLQGVLVREFDLPVRNTGTSTKMEFRDHATGPIVWILREDWGIMVAGQEAERWRTHGEEEFPG